MDGTAHPANAGLASGELPQSERKIFISARGAAVRYRLSGSSSRGCERTSDAPAGNAAFIRAKVIGRYANDSWPARAALDKASGLKRAAGRNDNEDSSRFISPRAAFFTESPHAPGGYNSGCTCTSQHGE
ncbi:Hypothetical protein NTJ_04177 [Nesidiocoris tenuis]|uniref:Uncharacterized protein n=1 Tax=Nesidiocoris tenuis TaxID=355587 RepID=A0ABN7AJ35_9HEMI|nr:Hypothetical protein NTJ_04177 [Nesidiocoris tenuis]